jgi:hypothetical protein
VRDAELKIEESQSEETTEETKDEEADGKLTLIASSEPVLKSSM